MRNRTAKSNMQEKLKEKKEVVFDKARREKILDMYRAQGIPCEDLTEESLGKTRVVIISKFHITIP
jgi:hypothetical protein